MKYCMWTVNILQVQSMKMITVALAVETFSALTSNRTLSTKDISNANQLADGIILGDRVVYLVKPVQIDKYFKYAVCTHRQNGDFWKIMKSLPLAFQILKGADKHDVLQFMVVKVARSQGHDKVSETDQR